MYRDYVSSKTSKIKLNLKVYNANLVNADGMGLLLLLCLLLVLLLFLKCSLDLFPRSLR